MARSKQTSAKRDREDKKRKKRKQKEEKRVERKANSNKGKGFDSMIAYVDEMGRITATPPDPGKRVELKLEDIQLGARKESEVSAEEYVNMGWVSYYNEEKGYGFIKDSKTKESVFFHLSSIKVPLKLNDQVSFDKTMGVKGLVATSVNKIE